MKVDCPSVLLIYTGGTIGMIENPETGALENFNFDQLLQHVPELKRFNYRISSYQFDPPIDSSDMEPSLWAKIVKIINYNYDNFDGFVILHGTDTMAYTASALSFMLENLSKPVILTGSQLPIGTLRTQQEDREREGREAVEAMVGIFKDMRESGVNPVDGVMGIFMLKAGFKGLVHAALFTLVTVLLFKGFWLWMGLGLLLAVALPLYYMNAERKSLFS